jgi:hypothetical protein
VSPSAYDSRRAELEEWIERVKSRYDEKWWPEICVAIMDARRLKSPHDRRLEPRPDHLRVVKQVAVALDMAVADAELTLSERDALEQFIRGELGC